MFLNFLKIKRFDLAEKRSTQLKVADDEDICAYLSSVYYNVIITTKIIEYIYFLKII